MDYSRYNTEKIRARIRSTTAKGEKKVGFNIFRFAVIALVLALACLAAAGISAGRIEELRAGGII